MGCSLSDGAEEPIQSNDSPQKIQILFIGNSYTGTNGLPNVVARLSESDQSPVRFEVDAHTPRGRCV